MRSPRARASSAIKVMLPAVAAAAVFTGATASASAASCSAPYKKDFTVEFRITGASCASGVKVIRAGVYPAWQQCLRTAPAPGEGQGTKCRRTRRALKWTCRTTMTWGGDIDHYRSVCARPGRRLVVEYRPAVHG